MKLRLNSLMMVYMIPTMMPLSGLLREVLSLDFATNLVSIWMRVSRVHTNERLALV